MISERPSAFAPLRPVARSNEGCFSGGWGISGFVDSWPKTLVPSASNRSTPEWTLVDSVDSRQGPLAVAGRAASRYRRPLAFHPGQCPLHRRTLGRDLADQHDL